MSLGNSIVLGFCSAFGALVPSIYYDFVPTDGKTTFSDMLNTPRAISIIGCNRLYHRHCDIRLGRYA